jgi:membrane protein implicated in regulation of membrane protease activity
MYPNSALPAWELAVMAVVVVSLLAVWLVAVYLADRQPPDRREASGTAELAARDDEQPRDRLAA